MTISESSRIGKRGTLVIPAKLRRRFGIEEGSEVIADLHRETLENPYTADPTHSELRT